MKKYIVTTSVRSHSVALEYYASNQDWKLILVGDRKGPPKISDDRIVFLDIDTQSTLGFSYFSECPENHYARKNIGYLYAIAQGADIIAEVDDDIYPLPGWGEDVIFELENTTVLMGDGFFNAYSWFTDEKVWPRGYPLEEISNPKIPKPRRKNTRVGVWQFLTNHDPDVDAIYRLTAADNPIEFRDAESITLAKGLYCPFNSQNTFWVKKAFPYMYLPMSVTFRFTDILRGYIGQKLLWEANLHLGFQGASTWQDRNPHNLMIDFQEEIPMYLSIKSLVRKMDSIKFEGKPLENLKLIYNLLAADKIVQEPEVAAVNSWAADLDLLGFD